MKKTTKAQWQLYKQLELIPDSVAQPKTGLLANIGEWFANLWHSLTSSSRTNEPDIWQTTDRYGNLWWRAYDPVTGQTSYLSSEDEVLMWLDQRHSFS
jgi:hypothetical protein